MAEEVVVPVIKLLIFLVNTEVELSNNVKSGIQSLMKELQSIQAFLRDADAKVEYDQGVKQWVMQVRDIAFAIEDCVDEYLIFVGTEAQNGFLNMISKPVTEIRARHKLADSILNIQKEVKNVAERKDRYNFKAVTSSFDQPSSSINYYNNNNKQQQRDPRLITPYLEDSEVLGMDGPRNDLVGLLRLDDHKATRSVISIVGMGGLGKSTLAKKVYDDDAVRKRFPHCAWISVSQCYCRVGLYKDVLKQLYKTAPRGIEAKDEGSLVRELSKCLQEKRYIIVFDDVWDAELWRFMECALPDDQNGSKIVMTTRHENVAATWKGSSNDFIYHLKSLAAGDAWDLFCRSAFKIDYEGKCPKWLETLSRDMVKRCGGLPLAILAIGRLLSTKEKVASEWKTVNDSFGFELGRSLLDISRILLLSYHDLPYYLKPCFLYFGVFPEDYHIDRMRVIRLWIAEGFVQAEQGNLTLEEVADQYLIELVHRNMIQISKRDETKRPRAFRVHDLYRECILSKLHELRFCQVNKSSSENDRKFRRLSIHNDLGDTTLQNSKAMHPRIRSLVVIQARERQMVSLTRSLLASTRLLKVIDFQDAPIVTVPDEIGNLYHLRYLCLRNTKVETLPSSVGKLHNLQTLDLKESCVHKLPIEIKELQNLRHLLAYRYGRNNAGFIIPNGVIGCLKQLQKVAYIEIGDSHELIDELRNLKCLRKLAIMRLKAKDGSAFCNVVETMVQLESFHIDVYRHGDHEILDLQHMKNPPPLLQRLTLRGQMERLPRWFSKLINLERLTLFWSKLKNDPVEVLETLPNLKRIALWSDSYVGNTLHFGASGFKKLKVLDLFSLPNLEAMVIEKGAAPALEKLHFKSCSSLKKVPSGIQHLDALSMLHFRDMPSEIIQRMQAGSFDNQFVKHIPVVRYGIRDRITGELTMYTL